MTQPLPLQSIELEYIYSTLSLKKPQPTAPSHSNSGAQRPSGGGGGVLNPSVQYPVQTALHIPATGALPGQGAEGYYTLLHLPGTNTILASGDSSITWFDIGLKACTQRWATLDPVLPLYCTCTAHVLPIYYPCTAPILPMYCTYTAHVPPYDD